MYIQRGFASGEIKDPMKEKSCLASSVEGGTLSFVLNSNLSAWHGVWWGRDLCRGLVDEPMNK